MFQSPTGRFISQGVIDLTDTLWMTEELPTGNVQLIDDKKEPLLHHSKLVSIYPGEDLYAIVHHRDTLSRIRLTYDNYRGNDFGKLVKQFPIKWLYFDEYTFPIIAVLRTHSGWTFGDMFWRQFNISNIKGYDQISKNKVELFTHDKKENIWTLYRVIVSVEKMDNLLKDLRLSRIPSRVFITEDFLKKYLPAGE